MKIKLTIECEGRNCFFSAEKWIELPSAPWVGLRIWFDDECDDSYLEVTNIQFRVSEGAYTAFCKDDNPHNEENIRETAEFYASNGWSHCHLHRCGKHELLPNSQSVHARSDDSTDGA